MNNRFPLRALCAALGFVASVALGAALIDDDPVPAKGESGMGKPAAASWGAGDQKTARPTAPHRTDIPWFQTLVDAAPAGKLVIAYQDADGEFTAVTITNVRI